ncbi:hypothetical protein D3C75_1184240 [compost metagenome]
MVGAAARYSSSGAAIGVWAPCTGGAGLPIWCGIRYERGPSAFFGGGKARQPLHRAERAACGHGGLRLVAGSFLPEAQYCRIDGAGPQYGSSEDAVL